MTQRRRGATEAQLLSQLEFGDHEQLSNKFNVIRGTTKSRVRYIARSEVLSGSAALCVFASKKGNSPEFTHLNP